MSKNLHEKYEKRSVLPQFERNKRKEWKYKNHWQAEYHHTLKRKNNSVKCRALDSSLGPLVYEVNGLLI